ncbi:hypothetical protein [Peredibacter starrii]|uniref:Uncharacterized protein n=1 Tax=Peredibacter starrii TaxID=28202 RepID=A0AAX4HN04_9BACT|nr:hypothetical protein [Peredibacter starrii]WPU64601.1 hypothetical protein SOO65_18055 [Peredibacter starrii]
MIVIKKDSEDFKRLSLEVLDACPVNTSKEFMDGYIDFVDAIFEELEGFSNIFWNYRAGTCEIDFELIFDSANKTVTKRSSSIEFLRGARLAEKETLAAMIFAFKFEPKHQEA